MSTTETVTKAPAGRTGTYRRRRPPLRYVVVGVLAVVALLAGLVGPAAYGHFANRSAKDRIAADPPPTLFPAAVADHRIDPLTAGQPARAASLMQAWWKEHGTKPDDAAFRTWLEAGFPQPPTTAARAAEMDELVRLDAARTRRGVAAATWLETHGKKDIWKLAEHDQAEYLPAKKGDDRKAAEKDLLKMAKKVADDLGAKYQLSAPYVLRPSLRPEKKVRPGQVCTCSYPSKHASAAAASRTFLGDLMPQRDSEYRWWQDQIDYSRIYMAGHFPSDITGGTLLGDMIGDYFLVTRAGVDPSQLPAD